MLQKFVLLLLVSNLLFAIGNLSDKDIYETETTTIVFEFDHLGVNVETESIPHVNGLEISGPHVTQSTQFINGNQSSATIIEFRVSPQYAGKFIIPPLRIKADGKIISSAQQTLIVHKGANPNVSNSPFSIGGYRKIGNAKAELYLSKKVVYQGEPFEAFYAIGTQNFTNVAIDSQSSVFADLHDLYFETYPSKDTPKIQSFGPGYTMRYINERYFLIALKASRLKIQQHKITIVDPSRQTKPFTAIVPENVIEVRPLPEKNKPIDFSGNVGSFNLEYAIDSSSQGFKQHSLITLRLKIEGIGNFIHFENPIPEYNEASFKLIEKNEISKEYDHTKHSGQIIIEYQLMPIKHGRLSLGKINSNWFNPYSAQYESKTIPLGFLDIQKSDQAEVIKIEPHTTEKSSGSNTWFLVISFIVASLFIFKNKVKIIGRRIQAHKIFENTPKMPIQRINNSDRFEEIYKQIAGAKQGILLQQYLLKKGWTHKQIEQLQDLKSIPLKKITTQDIQKLERLYQLI